MSPQSFLCLMTTVSPLIVLAWHTGPDTFVANLNQAAREVVAAREQARSQITLGSLYCQFEAWDQATAAYLLASDWARVARDAVELGTALNGLGTVMLYRQHYELAHQCFRDAAQHLRPTNDSSQYAAALHNLGVAHHWLGHHSTALQHLENALALRNELWDVAGEAMTLTWMGRIYCVEKQFAYALACYESALDLCTQKSAVFEGAWFEAGLRCLIAKLAEQCHHADLAIGHYLDALKLVWGIEAEWSLFILQALGHIHARLENLSMATYYHQQVLKLAQQMGALSEDQGTVIAIAPMPTSHFAPTHPLSLYF